MKEPVKLPNGIGSEFGIIKTFKGEKKEFVVFKKDLILSAAPPDGFLIEMGNDYAVYGLKGKITRAFVFRKPAQRKLVEILRKRAMMKGNENPAPSHPPESR